MVAQLPANIDPIGTQNGQSASAATAAGPTTTVYIKLVPMPLKRTMVISKCRFISRAYVSSK